VPALHLAPSRQGGLHYHQDGADAPEVSALTLGTPDGEAGD